MISAIETHDHELACVYSRWYRGTVTHRARMPYGKFEDIIACSGVDQGCPIVAFGFAATVAPQTQEIINNIRNNLDGQAQLYTYLDDWYLWIIPTHISTALDIIQRQSAQLNLELQKTKIQIWRANCQEIIDEQYASITKSTMNCLGGHLKIQGDAEDNPH